MTQPNDHFRSDYTGNGGLSTYSFDFKIPSKNSLKVVVLDPAAPPEVTLAVDVNYTVAPSGINNPNGGTITLLGSYSPLASGVQLAIILSVPLTQDEDIKNNDSYNLESNENSHDRRVQQILSLKEELARALKLPFSLSAAEFDPMLPVTVKDAVHKVLITNADGNGLDIGPSVESLGGGGGGGGGAVTIDRFSGDGIETNFTLSAAPATEANTQVYISGVYQQKDTYSVTGTTLAFSSPPPVGTGNIEVVIGEAFSIGIPADGSVTTVKIVDLAVTTVKLLDLAVTAAKLAADAVTTTKILNLAVTTAKLAAAAVTAAKLAADAIHGQTEETDPSTDDEALLYDSSASALRKMTLANLLKVLVDLAEDTTPDFAADYVLSYDASAGAVKKVKQGNINRPPGSIVQVVHNNVTAAQSITAEIPNDDSIPQKTEGSEILTATITPKSASNKLLIEATIFFHIPQDNDSRGIFALFQDAVDDALAAISGTGANDGDVTVSRGTDCVTLRHYMTAGTTSATTFKIRGGRRFGGGGTLTINGEAGSRKFGGVAATVLTVTEIAA